MWYSQENGFTEEGQMRATEVGLAACGQKAMLSVGVHQPSHSLA